MEHRGGVLFPCLLYWGVNIYISPSKLMRPLMIIFRSPKKPGTVCLFALHKYYCKSL